MKIRNPRHRCHVGEAQGSIFLMKGQIASFCSIGKEKSQHMCFLNANDLDVPDKEKSMKEENGSGGELTSKCQREM